MNKFPHHTTVPPSNARVRIAGHNVPAMFKLHKEWCAEQFGHLGLGRWAYKQGGHFYFVDEKDLTLFLLRWA